MMDNSCKTRACGGFFGLFNAGLNVYQTVPFCVLCWWEKSYSSSFGGRYTSGIVIVINIV